MTDTVLTLIATPLPGNKTGGLTPAIVARVRDALNAIGAKTDTPDWLHETIACDIAFSGAGAIKVPETARAALGDLAVDMATGPAQGRQKKLLLADMDSTIVTSETLDELAACAGIKDQVAAITTRAMAGELDFEGALRERVAMLKGLSEDALEKTMAGVELTPGAKTLAATMKKNGAHLILISGGFDYFTERVRALAGFDENISNQLGVNGGKLTGTVEGVIVDKTVKQTTLFEATKKRGLDRSETMAVGDGANDGPMIEAADLGVAYRGKPVLAEVADANILHSDLTALLYLQGYRAKDIISA